MVNASVTRAVAIRVIDGREGARACAKHWRRVTPRVRRNFL
jgi:hypothetical protein